MKRGIEEITITILADGKVDLSEYLGEAGFSALVDIVYDDSSKKRILFDTASSTPALRHNLRIAEVDPTTIEMIVLSHGHWDHVGGVMEILNMIGKQTPVLCHPQALSPKIIQDKAGKEHQIGIHNYFKLSELENRTDVITSTEPYTITTGVMTTGEVPRTNDFEKLTGRLTEIQTLKDGKRIPDLIDDDLSLAFHLKDDSIVILAGCCHSGIVNTAKHVSNLISSRSITGIVGGLHLHDASKERLSKTVEHLSKYPLTTLAPCHCTGLKGQAALMYGFESIFKSIGAGSVLKFIAH
ncbi:MAG: MBL fold metallo-hydrolase [Candidatus Thorarchaeota archaeon]|nr:MBL fold metallo-hydrolase [Candidatus Thorarchaeota archaeon]